MIEKWPNSFGWTSSGLFVSFTRVLLSRALKDKANGHSCINHTLVGRSSGIPRMHSVLFIVLRVQISAIICFYFVFNFRVKHPLFVSLPNIRVSFVALKSNVQYFPFNLPTCRDFFPLWIFYHCSSITKVLSTQLSWIDKPIMAIH